MIKFFRHLRQNLMETGKTSKPALPAFGRKSAGRYLEYAIGEIVLVVIGILIALQINNWNVGRIEKDKEKVIILNLHTEFKENLKDLDSIQLMLTVAIDASEIIFKMFQEDVSNYNTKTIDSLLSLSLTSPSWKPSEFVLNDLENSGGLSKLSSTKLKKLLFEWSRFFNEIKETNHDIEYTTSEYIKFIKDHGSMRNVDVSDPTFKYRRSNLQIDNVKLIQNFKFEIPGYFGQV